MKRRNGCPETISSNPHTSKCSCTAIDILFRQLLRAVAMALHSQVKEQLNNLSIEKEQILRNTEIATDVGQDIVNIDSYLKRCSA